MQFCDTSHIFRVTVATSINVWPLVMTIIDRYIRKAQANPRRVLLPEGEDPRILAAAQQLVDDGIAQPVLLGTRSRIAAVARAESLNLDGIEILDPNQSNHLQGWA